MSTILKCKMCGGDIEVNADMSVGTCQYCGTKQTLIKTDNSKKVMLYERANHFRRSNNFDKALGLYELILNEDNTDAEAYWSIVLCRYGIEYVEDPATLERIPTVNRVQHTSIFSDVDFQEALKHADGQQKLLYTQEAERIDEIQKGILAISAKEEPFDVFICYKESDYGNERTEDSVHAQDIYQKLTSEGYRVFFSRITLEGKLGTAYEPYIFAALNSAKVMLVITTSQEHVNAPWVRNEWSRYLDLMKQGKDKTLIPIYKDMSPYDLPEEFSYLQAQDMSKIGFIQDLIHGIGKIIKPMGSTQSGTGIGQHEIVIGMLQRAESYLHDGDFIGAERCFQNVLDYDPENGSAHIGLLLVENNKRSMDELYDSSIVVEQCKKYKEAIRYASEEEAEKLLKIKTDNEQKRKENTYQKALRDIQRGTYGSLCDAVDALEKIEDWKDARQRREKAIIARSKSKKKLKGKLIAGGILVLVLLVVSIIGLNIIIDKVAEAKYEEAIIALEQGDFERATELLQDVDTVIMKDYIVKELDTILKIYASGDVFAADSRMWTLIQALPDYKILEEYTNNLCEENRFNEAIFLAGYFDGALVEKLEAEKPQLDNFHVGLWNKDGVAAITFSSEFLIKHPGGKLKYELVNYYDSTIVFKVFINHGKITTEEYSYEMTLENDILTISPVEGGADGIHIEGTYTK